MSSLYLLDPLSCLEDHHYLEEEQEEDQDQPPQSPQEHHPPGLPPADELRRLLAKQAETHRLCLAAGYPKADPFLAWARREAADWILRASGHLAFCPQTALLAVDCLDRFLSSQRGLRERQPWMAQLAAVACLSVAAKVEETRVPLLLDLQVEESRFVFEARTVQRMELLVLSTLGWRMNPVTPLSLVDHLARRMGPGSSLFQARCHSVLLSTISDPRWVEFLPSTLAAAAALRCLDDRDLPCFETHFLPLLGATLEEVLECSHFLECAAAAAAKRSRCRSSSPPPSPTGVVGSSFSCGSSGDSWEAAECPVPKKQRFGIAGEIER